MTDLRDWIHERIPAGENLERRQLSALVVERRMGHYEPGEGGLRRSSITYADEMASGHS